MLKCNRIPPRHRTTGRWTIFRPLLMIAAAVGPLLATLAAGSAAAQSLSTKVIVDGFNSTVFGSEYAPLGVQSGYVRKFSGPVRFHVSAERFPALGRQVRRFIRSLPEQISGLETRIVEDPDDANFRVHVVKRSAYLRTVREIVYRSPSVVVRGRCMVRARFTRSGIKRADAVIVGDEGTRLFKRCMTEEILQGLGPLNDNRSLKYSMFNDTTGYTSMTRFDRIILNMLYDPSIENGDQASDIAGKLPQLARKVRSRIR